MSATIEIRTPRLRLRRWRALDLAPFAAMNADPRVVLHLPGPMTREASDALVARVEANFTSRGFDVFAVEVPGVASLIGFVGLTVPRFEAAFTPCVEIGWRMAFDYWGRGYATEAARGALDYAFETLKLAEVVSFIASDKASWVTGQIVQPNGGMV